MAWLERQIEREWEEAEADYLPGLERDHHARGFVVLWMWLHWWGIVDDDSP